VESGLDPDLFTVVHGGPEAGRSLIGQVDYVAFTGGTVTGRKVAMAAAERLIPFSLELGGKNPMIVSREAPLEQAAAALVTGAFANAGSTSRVLYSTGSQSWSPTPPAISVWDGRVHSTSMWEA
jgi:succinate-semialdehyde dehydrogenase/glutarate-semialdehyde dehydrogenase